MKKHRKHFLLSSFILGYISFGYLLYTNISFLEILQKPIYLALLILGVLSPFIGSFITFILNKDSLGGPRAFLEEYKKIQIKRAIILIPTFFLIHYGLGILFNNIFFYKDYGQYMIYLPIVGLLFATQEIGWRTLVQASFQEEKGYNKSIIITGLFWSLWFLPLIFIRGFIVMPQFYVQFTILLVGISFLLTSLYRISGSILYTSLLSGLIFSFYPILIFKLNFLLLPIAILEAIVSYNFKFKKK